MKEAAHEEVVRQVIRGERLWTDLKAVGAVVSTHDMYTTVEYTGDRVIVPELVDIALGFAAYASRPNDLRLWASVILSASLLIDLGAVEGRPNGDQLIEGLWDAADDGRIAGKTWAVVQQLLGT